MAGPYNHSESSPQQPVPPSDGRYGPSQGPTEPYPEQGPSPYPGAVPSSYPGALPPPVPYPKPSRRKRLMIAGIVVAVVGAIAAVATLVVFATEGGGNADGALTPQRAQTAIQDYMDALSSGDDETIARNASCGLFDEIKDRRADMSLANLASDAFRRQFKSAEVTSIDKIVTWSSGQAQVLFTMRVTAARTQGDAERQAVAQVLTADDDVLVCSYLPRTGQY